MTLLPQPLVEAPSPAAAATAAAAVSAGAAVLVDACVLPDAPPAAATAAGVRADPAEEQRCLLDCSPILQQEHNRLKLLLLTLLRNLCGIVSTACCQLVPGWNLRQQRRTLRVSTLWQHLWGDLARAGNLDSFLLNSFQLYLYSWTHFKRT
jgi:hypothetical protein